MTEDERIYYAEHGSANDIYTLMSNYALGAEWEDIEKDDEKALSYLAKLIHLAKNGDIIAQYHIVSSGKSSLMRKLMEYNSDENINYLQQIFSNNIKRAAKEGSADAIYADACITYSGYNCDEEKFQAWFKLAEYAAQNGSTWACSELIWTYVYEGHNITDKSVEFIKIGANGTDVYASKCQDLLARLYRFGDEYGGVKFAKDEEKFVYWAKKAYQNGSLEAKKQLDSHCRTSSMNTNNNANSGGCYVATAIYGSYDCPEVWTLRRYRDNVLKKNVFGRAFVCLYYAVSPTIVKWFGKEKWFNSLFKNRLDRFVRKLNFNGIDNSPYRD